MAERTNFYGSNMPKSLKSPCSFQKTGCSFHRFELIFKNGQKRKVQQTRMVTGLFWRRVRDSNPRSLSGHSISSAAPSTTRTTLRVCNSAILQKNFWKELTERTPKLFSFRTVKPLDITGFLVDKTDLAL